MWKTCNIVMLSAKKSGIALYDNVLCEKRNSPFDYKENSIIKPKYLYITSDEEIKEDNYGLSALNEVVLIGKLYDKSLYKKIIATTDISLGLPLISQQFIEKYIEEYNKGNVITKVKVEEECIGYYPVYIGYIDVYGIKVNPDNTINIKPIKDSYNRKEVIKIIHSICGEMYKKCIIYSPSSVNNWIEENL